jgi:hypothetical protein
VLGNASSAYPRQSPEDSSDPQSVSRASALATDCKVEVDADPKNSMKELRQNKALGTDPSLSA